MQKIDLRRGKSTRIERPFVDEPIEEVRAIIEDVRSNGDAALLEYGRRFDGAKLDAIEVSEAEMNEAVGSVAPELIGALEEAQRRIGEFAEKQLLQPWKAEVDGGVLGESINPVNRAGIYVPGGRATYPSTVLMCATPANVAGVGTITMCVPPARDGTVAASSLAAARLAGVGHVYKAGGAQAIAALAFGTESIKPVDVVCGPGNVYVALAKREVAGMVGIDSVAGPSEIAIVADADADADVVAADLISQAEHGPGGLFALVTWSEELADSVRDRVNSRLDAIEASADLRKALDEGLVLAVASGSEQAVDVVNDLAPEHLEILTRDADELADSFETAGAVFVGKFSPVSLGDYLAGSNHVLPTGGAARWASGLRTSTFQRASAVVEFSEEGLGKVADHLDLIAQAEGLPNHSRAVRARLGNHRKMSDRDE